jgi:hypothetical protein
MDRILRSQKWRVEAKWRTLRLCNNMMQGIKTAKCLPNVRQKLFTIIEAKMIEGIFIGPQNKQLFENHDLNTKLNATERRAWEAFEKFCRNFLCNEKAENYSEILQVRIHHTVLWDVTCR